MPGGPVDLSPTAACMAPSDVMRASLQGDLEVRSGWISTSPVSEAGGVFSNRHLRSNYGEQSKAISMGFGDLLGYSAINSKGGSCLVLEFLLVYGS